MPKAARKKVAPYTPKQFAAMMRVIAMTTTRTPNLDVETNHGAADKLMYEQMCRLGFKAGAEIFRKMEKWYA